VMGRSAAKTVLLVVGSAIGKIRPTFSVTD
jgi:hypothetical protein